MAELAPNTTRVNERAAANASALAEVESLRDAKLDAARQFASQLPASLAANLLRKIDELAALPLSLMNLGAINNLINEVTHETTEARDKAASELQQTLAVGIQLTAAAAAIVEKYSHTPLSASNMQEFLHDMAGNSMDDLPAAERQAIEQKSAEIMLSSPAGRADAARFNALPTEEKQAALQGSAENGQLLEDLEADKGKEHYRATFRILKRNNLANAPGTRELLEHMQSGDISAEEAKRQAEGLRNQLGGRMQGYGQAFIEKMTPAQRADMTKNGIFVDGYFDVGKLLKYADEHPEDKTARSLQAQIATVSATRSLFDLSRDLQHRKGTEQDLANFNLIVAQDDTPMAEREAALRAYLQENDSVFSKLRPADQALTLQNTLKAMDNDALANGDGSIFQRARDKNESKRFIEAIYKGFEGEGALLSTRLVDNIATSIPPATSTPSLPPVTAPSVPDATTPVTDTATAAAPTVTPPVINPAAPTPQDTKIPSTIDSNVPLVPITLPPLTVPTINLPTANKEAAEAKVLRNEGATDSWDITFENKLEDRLKKALTGKDMAAIVATLGPLAGGFNVGRQDNLSINEIENAMMAEALKRDPTLKGDARVVKAADINQDGLLDLEEIKGWLSSANVTGGQVIAANQPPSPPAPTPAGAAPQAAAVTVKGGAAVG